MRLELTIPDLQSGALAAWRRARIGTEGEIRTLESSLEDSHVSSYITSAQMVGEDRIELSPRVPKTRMLALHHTPLKLAEATGVEPAHATRGELANRCHTVRRRLHLKFQSAIHLCYKMDEGRERHCIDHTSRHTSTEDGELADSPKAPSSSSVKAPCLHPSQTGTSIIKKLKERAICFPGKLPAPSILFEFAFEIWERESAPAD